MLTKRCSTPFLISLSPIPEYRLSRSVMTSESVAPSADTVFSPFVTGRRIVGTDTETLIKISSGLLLCLSQHLSARLWLIRTIRRTWRRPERIPWGATSRAAGLISDDLDGFFRHHAVPDPVRAELMGLRFTGGNQDVVRLWFAGIGDVRAARVGLGPGVRVVDDDHFLIGRVQLLVKPQLFERIETVERRRPFG